MKNTKRSVYIAKEKFPIPHNQDHEPTQLEIDESARRLRQAMLLGASSTNMITFIELGES